MKQKIKFINTKVLIVIIKILYKIVKKKHGRICIIDETPNSGSNARSMYNYLTKEVKYEDVFITRKYIGKGMTLKEMYMVASSHIYLCTHGSFKVSKDRICIQAWHGVPLKGMNFMDKGETEKRTESWHKNFNQCDIVLSSSNLYEVLLSSCIGIQKSKFVKTGFPRNDFLTMNKDVDKASIISSFQDSHLNMETKILVYLPTFRLGHKKDKLEGKLRKGNIFGFETFDTKELEKNLKDNNCVIIAKLHPMEEKILSNNDWVSDKVKLINSTWLEERQIDLYEVLRISDMLITDYSSVYFDYLLLNKPIIFMNDDLNQYRQNRGLLLEPYNFWTPGYKVGNQNEFIQAIVNSIKDPDLFTAERKQIKEMIIETEDTDNCKRLWELVYPLLNK